MKSAKHTSKPADCASVDPSEIKWPMVIMMMPDVPPETSAVLAFHPINVTDAMPHTLRKTP